MICTCRSILQKNLPASSSLPLYLHLQSNYQKKVLPGCQSAYYNFLYVHHVRDMVWKLSSVSLQQSDNDATTLQVVSEMIHVEHMSSTCRVYAINIFHQLTNIIALRVWYITEYIHRWVGIPHDLGIHSRVPAASKPASSSSHSVCVCVCVCFGYIHECGG